MSDYASYAWKITHDSIADDEFEAPSNNNAKGMTGPRNVDPSLVARLDAAIGMGRKQYYAQCSYANVATPLVEWFKIYDDDNEIYYTGVRTGEAEEFGSEDGFEPLDDFGTPNAGATEIRYFNPKTGEFKAL